MKIVILGAGQVGSSVARILTTEGNDVTIVDQRPELLKELQDRLDIRTVTGHASHPGVLRQAGGEDAEMIIALTNSDEVNMVACRVAWTLFRTPTKIARIRATDYIETPKLFASEAIAVDFQISPEQSVTDYIQRVIENPGSLQLLDFADGRLRLACVKADKKGNMVGKALNCLPVELPGIRTRVVAVFREGQPIIPDGDTVIRDNDEVFFIAASRHTRGVMRELCHPGGRIKRIIIAGGGNIGRRLAQALEGRLQVKIIERNPEMANRVADELQRTIVLLGDAADEELLLEENIEHTDVFCAVTNDDEANILSAMLAKRLGARKVMSLINRPAYVDLVEDSETIDIAISPQQATIGSLLTHVRRGDVVKVHSLRRGAAEALEAIAHGDAKTSRVVGRVIDDIDLPRGTSIGALVRGDEVLMAHHDTTILSGDHVIMLLTDKRRISDVERLFQVSVTFL